MADVMATVVNAAARMPARVSDRVWVRHRQAGEGGWCSASSRVKPVPLAVSAPRGHPAPARGRGELGFSGWAFSVRILLGPRLPRRRRRRAEPRARRSRLQHADYRTSRPPEAAMAQSSNSRRRGSPPPPTPNTRARVVTAEIGAKLAGARPKSPISRAVLYYGRAALDLHGANFPDRRDLMKPPAKRALEAAEDPSRSGEERLASACERWAARVAVARRARMRWFLFFATRAHLA